MAFTEEENKIINILEGGDTVIFKSIELLIKDYKEKTGKKVNSSCPSCVRVVILTLKNIYKMVNFKFKRPSASYKNKKGDKTTISNSTMTDEKAIEFLKTNPERIRLFSEFPTNWKKLIKGEVETEEEKEKRIAIEAEITEASKAKAETSKKADLGQKVVKELIEEGKDSEDALKAVNEGLDADKTVEEIVASDNPTEKELEAIDEDGNKTEGNDVDEALRADLMKMSLKDLRKEYPNIKATSIPNFVDKVLNL